MDETIMPLSSSHQFIVCQMSHGSSSTYTHDDMDDDVGDCQSLSEERLQSLDNTAMEEERDANHGCLPTTAKSSSSGGGWNPFSVFFDDSTPSLAECSSRSSSQDLLDLSVDEEFELSPLGQQQYLKRVEKDEDGPKTPVTYLPSVLRRPSPRSVSFSSVETVFELHDDDDVDKGSTAQEEADKGEETSGLIYPRTPVSEWYASKGSSSLSRSARPLPPPRHALPPLATTTSRRPHLQPRRSALKKPGSTSAGEIQFPVSPKITWYTSSKP